MLATESRSKRPLLTVAIPTYNRAECLSLLLDNLCEQVRDQCQVELLISDNNSTDGTQALVEGWLRRGIPIRYIRNAENIGADRNFLQCFEMALSKYVWIVGDDDVIIAGALKKILRHLSVSEYDLVYVSSSNFSEKYLSNGFETQESNPKLITNAADLARRVHVFFTFISGNIINKDRVDTSSHRPFLDLANSNLIQLGWTYTALRNHRRSLFFNDRLVAAKAGNTGGYGLFKVFGSNLKRVTEEWLLDETLTRIILNATLQSFIPPYVLGMRTSTDHRFSREDPHEILRAVFHNNWRYWIFVYPLAVMPFSLATIWSYLLRATNKLDRMLGQPLIRYL